MTRKQKLAAFTIGLMIFQSSCVRADYSDNKGTINLDSFTVTGNGIAAEGTTVTITQGGDFTVTGTAHKGMIYVDTEDKVKLRLSGMSLSNDDGPAIYFQNAEKALITVTEETENYLSDGAAYTDEEAKGTLFSNDDIEIKGKGTLTVIGNYKHGIAGDDDIKIENSQLNITAASDGIHANNTFHLLGGTVTIAAQSDGIQTEEDMIIDDGVILITQSEEGLESGTTMTFNGGDVTVTATDDGLNSGGGLNDNTEQTATITSPETATDQAGQEFMPGQRPNRPQFGGQEMQSGEFTPQQGQMPPQFTNQEGNLQTPPVFDGQGMPERIPGQGGQGGMTEQMETVTDGVDRSIYINGGTININAQGDGVDSNDRIYMTGGTLYIDGPANAGNGALDSLSFQITGGTVAAVGNHQMAMGFSQDSTQCGFMTSFATQAAGSELTVTDSTGTVLLSCTPQKEYSSLIYSSESLKVGEAYTVSVNGTQVSAVEQTETQMNHRGGFGGFGGGFRGEFNSEFIEADQNQQNRPQRQENRDDNRIKVILRGNELQFDSQPIIQNDTALVPLRTIFEALGMEVSWNEETQTVTAVKDNITITLTIGQTEAYRNEETINLPTAPVISDENRTLVPVRFIAESLKMNVGWEEETQTVTIDE